MTKPGPRKKPAPIHKARGTFKPSRHGGPALPVEIPDMPPDLPPTAQAVWKVIVRELEEAGIVSRIDRTALALLCESVWLYKEAMDDIHENGISSLTDKGNKIQNPAVGVRNKAWAQIVKLCQEFGMTPSARTGLHVSVTGDDEDEAADIIGFKVG